MYIVVGEVCNLESPSNAVSGCHDITIAVLTRAPTVVEAITCTGRLLVVRAVVDNAPPGTTSPR